MHLIIGLGNPGKKFKDTRHNIGFWVIESLVKELTPLLDKSFWNSIKKPTLEYAKIQNNIFAKPLTYINLSGLAVTYLINFFKIEKQNIWVVHDDIDLPLGRLRIRRGGASGGHNGIESIIKAIGEDKFVRFRIGIGRGKEHKDLPERNIKRRTVEKFVLSRFTTSEEGEIRKIVKKTVDALEYCLDKGIEKGMNKFN